MPGAFDDLIPGVQAPTQAFQPTGAFDDLVPKSGFFPALKSGYYNAMAGLQLNPDRLAMNEAAKSETIPLPFGLDPAPTPGENIASNLLKARSSYTPSKQLTRMNKQVDSGDYSGGFKTLINNPMSILPEIAGQSIPNTVPGLALAASTGGGSLAAKMAGMGLGSYLIDSKSTTLDDLRKRGVDMTDPAAIDAALGNKELMGKATVAGARHGLPVGVLDALSLGVAGKTLSPMFKSGVARQAVNIPSQVGSQGILGGLGEGIGQKFRSGKITSKSDILAEMLGEIAMAPAETVTARYGTSDQNDIANKLKDALAQKANVGAGFDNFSSNNGYTGEGVNQQPKAPPEAPVKTTDAIGDFTNAIGETGKPVAGAFDDLIPAEANKSDSKPVQPPDTTNNDNVQPDATQPATGETMASKLVSAIDNEENPGIKAVLQRELDNLLQERVVSGDSVPLKSTIDGGLSSKADLVTDLIERKPLLSETNRPVEKPSFSETAKVPMQSKVVGPLDNEKVSQPVVSPDFVDMVEVVASAPLTLAQKKAVSKLQRTVDKFGFATPSKVVNSPQDLPVKNAPADTKGLFHNGEVYLVKSNIKDNADALTVAVHEKIGHQGTRAFLKSQGIGLSTTLDAIYRDNSVEVKKVASVRDDLSTDTIENQRIATEEYIADQAEFYLARPNMPLPAWLNKLLVQLKAVLRKAGVNVKDWGKAELLDLLTSAKRISEKSQATQDKAVVDGARYSRTAADTAPDQQESYDMPKEDRTWWAKNVANPIIDKIDTLVDGTIIDPRKATALGRLGDVKTFKLTRYKAMGEISRADDVAAQFTKAFKDKKYKEAVFNYLTAGGSLESITDASVRNSAKEAKKLIQSVGLEAVRRGWLPSAVYEENKDTYLPRVYLKYLIERKYGTGGKSLDKGWLKARKDIPQDVREIILGEITDPAFLVARAITVPMHDFAVADYLTDIAKHGKEWVWTQSYINIITGKDAKGNLRIGMADKGGKRVTSAWLDSESKRLEKQIKYMKEDKQNAARKVVQDLRDLMHEADSRLAENNPDPSKFRQLPNSSKYGELMGMYVRKEIYNDLVGTKGGAGAFNDDLNTVRTFWKGMETWTAVWKGSKVALNPPSQFRNAMSNIILLNMSGMPLAEIPIYLYKAVRQINADSGTAWSVAKEYGVKQGTFYSNEMKLAENALKKAAQSSNPLRGLMSALATIYETAGGVYGMMEQLGKTAKIMYEMDNGADAGTAAIAAHETLFDYSLVNPSTKILRSSPIGIPFACVDDKTDILTARGWLTLDEVERGDMAASFNMNTQRLEWKKVLSVYRKDYGGKDLIYIKDRHLDMAMTPDHRCITYRRRRVPGKRAENAMYLSLEVQQAKDLNNRDHIPTAARFKHKAIGEPVSDTMTQLVGWYVTEGADHKKCGQVTISQNEGEDLEKIKALLIEAGFTWKEYKYRFKGGNADHVFMRIHARHGKQLRVLAPGKQLNPSFLMRLTTRQIKLLVNTMIDGDGHTRKYDGRKQFLQNPGITLDTFQMALTMLGISFNVRNHGDRCKVVTLRGGKNYCIKRAVKESLPYYGRIWCPMIQGNETWVARRNGKPFITHNTFYTKMLARTPIMALKHPVKFALWSAGLDMASKALMMSLYDVGDDDVDRLKKDLPGWIRAKGHAFIFPLRDSSGRWVTMDFSYLLPWATPESFARNALSGNIDEMLQETGLFGAPLSNMIAVILTNKDPFTKREIVKSGDPAAKQIISIMTYLWNMNAPTFINTDLNNFGGGSGTLSRIYQAASGKVSTSRLDYGEEKASLPQALARIIGINLYPIDPEVSRKKNIMQMNRGIRDTRRRMIRELRRLQPGSSDEERNKLKDTYLAEINLRIKQREDYMDKSEIHPNLKRKK